jgi:hypothetical protein
MNLEELRNRIDKMHKDGLSNTEIAERLKKQGVKSLRGSKEPTATMVGYHVRKLQEEKPAPTEARPTPTVGRTLQAKNPNPRKVQLAQEILAGEMAVKDKCELVAILLLS